MKFCHDHAQMGDRIEFTKLGARESENGQQCERGEEERPV